MEINFDARCRDSGIEIPEAVKQWGDVIDWHHAVGTGPFILTDYISGSSVTMEKGIPVIGKMDERYPQNRLPYIDKLVYLIMPDESTALAALRSGKIDVLDKCLYFGRTIDKENKSGNTSDNDSRGQCLYC